MIAMGRPPRKPWIVATLASVAEFFDVSETTVRTSWRPAGCPGTSGHYDLRAILRWRDERQRAQIARASVDGENNGSPVARKLLADARRSEVSAARLEFEHTRELGEWVREETARRAWSRGMLRIKHRLENVPTELTNLVRQEDQASFYHDARAYIAGLLDEMSRWDPIRVEDSPP